MDNVTSDGSDSHPSVTESYLFTISFLDFILD